MKCKRENICRLCLRTVDNSQIIEETIRRMLDLLHLKVDLNISEEPVICTDCTNTIYSASDFKSVCTGTENSILSYVNSQNNIEVDIQEIFLKVSKYDNTKIEEGQKICRICMELKMDGGFTFLNNVVEDVVKLIDLLTCSDLKLNSVGDPVICSACLNSLQNYSSFIKRCVTVEERIKNYIDKNGISDEGQVNLGDVAQFVLKGVKDVERDDKTLISCCKIEATTEETVLPIEGIMETENLQLNIYKDEIEIKPDDSDKRCEGNTSLLQSKAVLMKTDTQPPEIMHLCEKCAYQTKYKRNLRQHMLIHKNISEVPIYKCDSCKMETRHKKSLEKHMLLHKNTSEVPAYKCELCAHQTRHKGNLQLHMLIHKSNSELPIYKCEICAHQSKYKTSFRRHMLLHKGKVNTSDVMYKCTLCEYQAKHKRNVQQHMLLHKNTSELQLYKCDLCEYQAKHKRSLQDHMLLHKSTLAIPLYKCDLCEYQTKRKWYLQEHTLLHKSTSEVQLYKCELCEHHTRHKRNLLKHMLLHKNTSEVQVYKCEICAHQTKHKGNLRLHMLVHKNASEIPVYKCEICAHQSKYKSSIRKHMLLHKSASEIPTHKCEL